MILLTEQEQDIVWRQVYAWFWPSALRGEKPEDTSWGPYQLPKPWTVYDISSVLRDPTLFEKTLDGWPTEEDGTLRRLTETVDRVFASCMAPGEQLYALDWHHSWYRFAPGSLEERKTRFVKDAYGGHKEYFPLYVPDGDYYYFFARDFRFGYLGHPWREEVWLFGEPLVTAFQKAVEQEPSLTGFSLKEELRR